MKNELGQPIPGVEVTAPTLTSLFDPETWCVESRTTSDVRCNVYYGAEDNCVLSISALRSTLSRGFIPTTFGGQSVDRWLVIVNFIDEGEVEYHREEFHDEAVRDAFYATLIHYVLVYGVKNFDDYLTDLLRDMEATRDQTQQQETAPDP